MAINRILLDTSGYSQFMRGHSGIVPSIQSADEIVMSPIVLGELYSGFLKGNHRLKNEQELVAFLASPRVNCVQIDEETAKRYSVILNRLLKEGNPIPTNDLWIASSAMQYGLTILTFDLHFLKIRETLVSHFEV